MAKTKTSPTDTPIAALQDQERLVVERLRRHLAYLGLTHTGATLGERLAWASRERPAHSAMLEHVLAAEVDHTSQARLTRRIHSSGLVEQKTLEAFDWDFQPTLDKSLVLELAQLGFVQRHDDLVITGKTGTGKSHVLKALGLRACVQGISLRYARCVDLLADLHAGLADNTYPLRLKAWGRGPTCSSSMTWASVKCGSETTSPPLPILSSISSIEGMANSPPPSLPISI